MIRKLSITLVIIAATLMPLNPTFADDSTGSTLDNSSGGTPAFREINAASGPIDQGPCICLPPGPGLLHYWNQLRNSLISHFSND